MTILERRPIPARQPVEQPSGPLPPMLAVRADLLPDEIVVSRRARATQRRVIIGLALVLASLIAGYGFSWLQTHNANDDLSAAQNQIVTLTQKQQQFGPLVQAQAQTAQVQQMLTSLMANDLDWAKLLAAVRSKASDGVTVTNVTGTVSNVAAVGSVGAPTGGGLGVLNATGQAQIGTLTISGSAPSKDAVAAFVDRLGGVTGLAAAFPANVAGNNGQFSYSVNVLLTSDVLGGRFTLKTSTTEGN
jgi:Tfp pilus assembly protein PilN